VKLIAIAAAALGLAACTPHQVETFKTLDPASQRAVLDALSTPTDCYQAIDRHWPGDKEWARAIVWRESRNIPSAQNAASTAAGCFQMLDLHAWRFGAVGCSWGLRYDAACNTKAAAHLYAEAGASPWRFSA
jgi:hypothetical protein